MSSPFATVIVPIRNEELYLRTCLNSLLQQTYPSERYEVIVVDGRSSDRSREIIEDFAHHFPNVRCVDNPAAIAPVAMNIGIRCGQGSIIIRADGHSFYSKNYVENCVKYLQLTGADNVGGPWITVPADGSFGACLVAAILSNPFGVGDSRFRIGHKEGLVKTVPFGAFRREIFDRVGMYNEKLVRNQDNELNARIRQAGGRIYQTPALQTEYHPVEKLGNLLRQTFRTSQWHFFTIRNNAAALCPRHFAPLVFLLLVTTLLLASFIGGGGATFGALILLSTLYLLTGFSFAAARSRRFGFAVVSVLPFACFCFHLAYGLGTLVGLKYLFKSPSARPIRAGQPVSQVDGAAGVNGTT